MFCPNCGKEIKEYDNFCRYCGADLRVEEAPKKEAAEFQVDEEYVLYDVKKHSMSLVMPVFLIPLFLLYFWNIFLNTHSIFSWVVVIALLALIIYPIARYKSDNIVITNKFAHIKVGVLNPAEIALPLNKLSRFEITQTSMGRMLGYGVLSFVSNSEKYDYGYICEPEELQYIVDNPSKFVSESLEDEVCV